MPTGYTEDLEKRNYDVKSWLKEGIIRAMGVCVAVRDDGNLSEKEIIKRIGKDPKKKSYNEEALERAKKELAKIEKLTDKEWEKLYIKTFEEAQADYDVTLKEFCRKKLAHQNSLDKVKELYNKAISDKETELVIGTLKYAVEQLKQVMDFDYGHKPYKADILDLSDWKKWRMVRTSELKKDITYHEKELKKKAERTEKFDPAAEYTHFVEFVNKAKI